MERGSNYPKTSTIAQRCALVSLVIFIAIFAEFDLLITRNLKLLWFYAHVILWGWLVLMESARLVNGSFPSILVALGWLCASIFPLASTLIVIARIEVMLGTCLLEDLAPDLRLRCEMILVGLDNNAYRFMCALSEIIVLASVSAMQTCLFLYIWVSKNICP